MNAESRSDGWWLQFDQGEEAGPFPSLTDAQTFLNYVEELQQKLLPGPESNSPPRPHKKTSHRAASLAGMAPQSASCGEDASPEF